MRGKLALTIGFGSLLAMPGVAYADSAPAGHASAVAAQVDEIVAVAHTEANAGPEGNDATANAVELGGDPPSQEFGGTQEGPGESKGALVDTGDDPNFSVKIAPWSATVDERSAVAKAALARLQVAGAVSADILQSESSATYDGNSSSGSSSSDGAVVNAGGEDGLTIVVLHSEASSEAKASGSYLLAINDNTIGSSDDANGACLIEIPSLVRITCLTASGGKAGDPANEFEAQVLGAVVGGDEGLLAQVSDASSSGGAGAAPAEVEAARGSEPATQLPFTGASPVMALAGLGLLGAAGAIYRMRRAIA